MPSPPLVEPPACEVVDAPRRIVGLAVAGRRRQHEPARCRRRRRWRRGLRAVSLSTSMPSAVLTSGSLFGVLIEPETSIRNTRLRGGSALPADSAPAGRSRQPVRVGSTGTRPLGGHRERLARRRRRVVVAEVVDQLLDPDGVRRRQLSLVQEAPDVGVRGRVHVDREGGQRILGGAMKAVLVDAGRRPRCCTDAGPSWARWQATWRLSPLPLRPAGPISADQREKAPCRPEGAPVPDRTTSRIGGAPLAPTVTLAACVVKPFLLTSTM